MGKATASPPSGKVDRSFRGQRAHEPEIGAQLFISSHTVEWHLRKVFSQLGTSSRREIRTMRLEGEATSG
ncbi:helix-turn-helix transcriptional regulator [Streptomyces sp. NBC_01373]|nr:LuxR C-terminal-related transcriptional regulator [Streptomyces sp. NBC_01373]MCX4702709.1 LuxR C-terminal-related transcriptional regulator [Streptomyces sp. NBC_01373]